MADAPLSLAEEEYRALRATIRERGSARPIVMTLTVVSWAAVSAWLHVSGGTPLLSLIALMILDAGFESVFSIHVGVERIGRYLQVRYESTGGPGWEHAAMRPLPPAAGKPADALFSWVFLTATALNLVLACWLAALVLPVAELSVVFVAHVALVWRILGARRFASTQRERELAHFQDTLTPWNFPNSKL